MDRLKQDFLLKKAVYNDNYFLKKMIFLFLLIHVAVAHMPVFGNCRIDNTVSKSWGMYVNVKDSYSCLLNVPKGENVSFSISLPAQYVDPYDLEITLFGHGAADIICDPTFSGWGGVPAWRKLDAGLDSTKNIPLQNTTTLVFEPFGVGGYREIASCQGKSIIGDEFFNLTVHNLQKKEIPISIGIGMAESFTVFEIFLMSFLIAQTWDWSGSHFYIMTIIVSVLMYTIVCFKIKRSIWSHIISCSLIVNAVQFFCQIIYLYSIGVPVYENWLFPLLVHITLPLVVCILYYLIEHQLDRQIKGWAWVPWIIFLIYASAALWQAYCVTFVAILIVMIINIYTFCNKNTFKYTDVTYNQYECT